MKQKGLAPILIVVLIALILGGYLIYQQKTKYKSSLQPIPLASVQNVSPDKSNYPGPSDLVKPAKEYPSWETIQTEYYAYQIPQEFEHPINQYSDSGFHTKASSTDLHCGVFQPSVITGGVSIQTISYDPKFKDISENDYYNLDNGYWGGSKGMSGNGGTGEITRQIVPLGNKKAIEQKILWTSGIECFYKPFINLTYYIFLNKDYPYKLQEQSRQIMISLRYFPDEIENKKLVDQILSTFRFTP